MIVALIIFILIFVFFALFIGMNLSNICNFWFFKTFEQVPAAVLVLMSFAMGIAFAVVVIIITKIKHEAKLDGEKKRLTRAERADKKRESFALHERLLRRNRKSTVSASNFVKDSDVNNE